MKETRSDVRDYVLIKTGSPVKRTVRRVQYQAQLLHSATSQPALERSTRRTQLANNCIISQTCCTIPTSILPCSSIPIVHQCPTFHQSHPHSSHLPHCSPPSFTIPSYSSNPLTLNSLTLNTVYRILLLTCLTCLCLLFVFSSTRNGSLSVPITVALHSNNLSSR
jgi:hypothetical protein